MGKIYLLIGATSEIGMAYLEKLNQQNEKMIVIAMYHGNKEKLESQANAWNNLTMDYVSCDLSKIEEVQKAAEYIKEKYEAPTHVLHLAARKFEYVKFTKFNWESICMDLEIQVHSFAELMKTFLPLMAKRKYGKVVVMLSSVTKGVPPKYLASYTLVKYALMGLVASLVSEYKEKGININAISPTMVETNFLSEIDERIVEMTSQNSSLKRNVKPEEVASGIEYLMSDEAAYINGLNLLMTGGDLI